MYAKMSDRPWLLYDLTKDRWETNNLVTAQNADVKAYDARLMEMMKRYGDSWSSKVDTGDVRAWLPGGPKQQSQNLGVPYPGEQKPVSDQVKRGKKGKKKASADDDE